MTLIPQHSRSFFEICLIQIAFLNHHFVYPQPWCHANNTVPLNCHMVEKDKLSNVKLKPQIKKKVFLNKMALKYSLFHR